MRVTESVILAAGFGSRLNGGVPKPLVEVGGRALLAHALGQARAAGCDRVVVVVGSEAEKVRGYLEDGAWEMDLEVVYNARFDAPNGVSLLAAHGRLRGAFYLQMVDHVFAEPVLSNLASAGPLEPGTARLLVDCAPAGIDVDDATRVTCSGGLVRRIGKGIAPWDAIDAGVFLLAPEVLEAVRRWELPEPSISTIMQRLADAGGLSAVRIGDVRWADVDTPRDRAGAEDLLSPRPRDRPCDSSPASQEAPGAAPAP